MLKIIWAPIAIVALLIAGLIYGWPLPILGPAMGALLLAGIFTTVSYFTQTRTNRSAIQLKEMAEYFAHRFAGNSSLSIFSVIRGLAGIDKPGVKEWLLGCNMSQLVFDAWCEGFTTRIKYETQNAKLIQMYLHELWSMIIHYQEFIDQFCRVCENAHVPDVVADQYNRLVVEYNPFVERFQDYVGRLRKAKRTEIEPPSVKLARELPPGPSPGPAPAAEREIPEPIDNKGYILGRRPTKRRD